MKNEVLQQHILSTYNSLRFGMCAITAATPIAIVIWGLIFGIDWQNSISAYYFAPIAGKLEYSVYPARVLFVGILFSLGSFLYLYKGFSRREDIALNVAGVSALGVALCPMYVQVGYIPFSNVLHLGFAVLLFLCVGYTAIFCHNETLQWLPDPSRRQWYRRAYHLTGWFMVLFPVIGLLFALLFDALQKYVFWIEAAGVWAFSAYWFTKSRELKESEVDLKAACGTLPQTAGYH